MGAAPSKTAGQEVKVSDRHAGVQAFSSIGCRDGLVAVRILTSRVTDEDRLRLMGEEIRLRCASINRPTVVIDFQWVEFLAPRALGHLILLHKDLALLGGRMLLLRLRPHLRELFQITGLQKVFRIEDDVSKLRQRLAAGGGAGSEAAQDPSAVAKAPVAAAPEPIHVHGVGLQYKVKCPHCLVKLRIRPSLLGETVACSNCQKRFDVPIPAASDDPGETMVTFEEELPGQA